MSRAIKEGAQENVSVQVWELSELINQAELPLGLDNYQRAYVWSRDKVQQLAEDLMEYVKDSCKSNADEVELPYYMGSVLLHRDEERGRLFIIDGQQRLTTLSVLYHTLHHALPGKVDFNYRSYRSVENIKQTQHLFASMDLTTLLEADVFSRIMFTVIQVESEDLAFTFFDTQNNRGVSLAATDLLKAFHLRAISGDSSDALQRLCAMRWESLQGMKRKNSAINDFAPVMFEKYLWRARRWTGQKSLAWERRDAVIEEFQQNCLPNESAGKVPLYPARSNCRAYSISLSDTGHYRLHMADFDITHHAAHLPFSIRQPISKGVGFFLYSEKYAALLKALLHETSDDLEVLAFREFYKKVFSQVSMYLQELYLLAILVYMDQFGTLDLLRFALWLDYTLGAIRIDKNYVFKEAIHIYLRERDHNLLDVIATAYHAKDIFSFLKSDDYAREVYRTENITGNGVQWRYKQAVLVLYNKADSLHGRDKWISDTFVKGLLK